MMRYDSCGSCTVSTDFSGNPYEYYRNPECKIHSDEEGNEIVPESIKNAKEQDPPCTGTWENGWCTVVGKEGGHRYHCGNCGAASNMYGHYRGDLGGFTCKKVEGLNG